MGPFAVTSPAAIPGQHVRNTGVAAASKPKQDKPSFAAGVLAKLSTRERVMLIVLIVLIAIAISTFLVILPSIEKLNSLNDEIVSLQGQKETLLQKTDQRPQYQSQLEAATENFTAYQKFYYSYMDPEQIDKTVTTMLLSNNMYPVRLSMSSVSHEDLPRFIPQALVPKPVPQTETLPANNASSHDDDAAEQPNQSSSALADPITSSTGLLPGTSVYCYTVTAEAKGWMPDLLGFLQDTRDIIGLEVVSYSYAEDGPIISTFYDSGDLLSDAQNGGTIIIMMKFYVFIDGGVTSQMNGVAKTDSNITTS